MPSRVVVGQYLTIATFLYVSCNGQIVFFPLLEPFQLVFSA